MDPPANQLICSQCQGRSFIEDGFSLVCQCCGLQVEKQATRYADDAPDLPGALHSKMIGRAATRKRDTIKEHVGSTRHGKRKLGPSGKTAAGGGKEDWSDYLGAYQNILKMHGEAAKTSLGIVNPSAFDEELKKVWFGYLDRWAESGVRLQGSFMEARRGCFKMIQPGKLQKRYFISNETVPEVGSEAIKQENDEAYQKMYAKEYEYLKGEFYKRKVKSKKGKSVAAKKMEDSKADTQSQLA